MRTILLLVFITGFSCQRQNIQQEDQSHQASYLALGDSYTIGESVKASHRWPVLLAKKINYPQPHIIAKTGWRTDQLLAAAKQAIAEDKKYELVSLLIGVNNQFQARSIEDFKTEFKAILKFAEAHSKDGKEGVFVLSIPDYGCTPYGKSNAKKIGAAIDQWNQAIEQICKEQQFSFYNITSISREGLKNPTLVASDGLHPSAKMYESWVELILRQPKFSALKTND